MLTRRPTRLGDREAFLHRIRHGALVLAVALVACGDDDGAAVPSDAAPTDGETTDAGQCGEAPVGPAVPVCQRWACTAVAYPGCWSCALASSTRPS